MRFTNGSVMFLIFFLLISCDRNKENKIVIDFNSPTNDSASISFHEDEAVHVAIASISSPRESYRYYNELLDYIASKIDIPVHSVQKQSYKEVNELLLDGAVDFAFISSGAYIDFNADEVDLLVAPVIDGQNHYHSYLITQKDNDFPSILSLKGKRFAFSDPLSHTGFNYPVSRLMNLNEEPENFFSEVVFSFGHDLSIEMVNREIVDGAYVHGLIYDFMRKSSFDKVHNTEVIEISPPFGIPPIVCPKKLNNKRYKLYQEIFLNLHNERKGREILNSLNIDRFEIVHDSLYDNVRAIKKSIVDETN